MKKCLPSGRFTALFMILLCVFLGLAGCGKAELMRYSGTIEAEELDIFSEVSGKVIESMANEGDIIKKNTEIIKIDDAKYAAIVHQAEASRDAALAQLNEALNGARQEEIRRAEAAAGAAKAKYDELLRGTREESISQGTERVNQAEAALTSAKETADFRKKNLDRLNELKKTSQISQSELDEAEHLYKNALTSLESADSQLKSALEELEQLKNGPLTEQINYAKEGYEEAKAGLDLLKAGAAPEKLDYLNANLEQAEAVLEQAKIDYNKCTVKSDAEGVLLYKNSDVGTILSVGADICTVQQTGNLWIKVYVPQKFRNRIELNQNVTIKTTALGDEDIKGSVVFISPKAEFTPKNVQTNESKEENTVFEVKVKINSNIEQLSAGMTADVLF